MMESSLSDDLEQPDYDAYDEDYSPDKEFGGKK